MKLVCFSKVVLFKTVTNFENTCLLGLEISDDFFEPIKSDDDEVEELGQEDPNLQLVEVSSIAPTPKPRPPPRPATPDIQVTGSRPGAPIRLGNNCKQPASYTLIHGKRIRVTEEVRKLCKPSDGLLIFRYLVGRRPHMNEIDRLMPIPQWRLGKKYDVEAGFHMMLVTRACHQNISSPTYIQ